jgi:tRNA U34 5-carboxymethylaminomethyl modifying GTPase MnmE/TrmE
MYEWRRFVITFTVPLAGSGIIDIGRINAYPSPYTYTGNTVNGISFFGAQLEVGAVATSYIPTTTAALTRAGDFASIVGNNFSSR